MSPGGAVLVGGCHLDIVARTDAPFVPGTSCPGRVRRTAGGVARNVAVLLAGAGVRTALVSRVGDDDAGRSLVAGLRTAGVDASAVTVDAAAATGTYVAVHGGDGELVAAVSDLSVYDRMTPAALAPAIGRLGGAGVLFADANLPEETLDALAAAHPRLAVDAISIAKAPRIAGAIRRGALGFANLPAATALAGRSVRDPVDAVRALAAAGARRLVVTGGPRPVAVLEAGVVTPLSVPPTEVTDVTGAGDALTAGVLAALAAGAGLVEAARIGIAAAAAALAGAGALDRLPPSVLHAIADIAPGGPAQ